MLFGFAGRASEPSSWAGSAAWVRASVGLHFWILVSLGRSFWVQPASRDLSWGVLAAFSARLSWGAQTVSEGLSCRVLPASSAGRTRGRLSASTRSAADAGGRAAAAREL